VKGGNVVVTRVVKKNGVVVRTSTFTSHYTPVDETVNVGTKPAAPKPAAGAAATKGRKR
jgi:hypothetical protein